MNERWSYVFQEKYIDMEYLDNSCNEQNFLVSKKEFSILMRRTLDREKRYIFLLRTNCFILAYTRVFIIRYTYVEQL